MLKTVHIDPRVRVKTADVDHPVILRVSKFTEEACEKFADGFSKAHELEQPIIPVIIDSYGGAIYALMDMITIVQNSSIPVATIVTSKAFSAGAVLFASGSKGLRFMAPHAQLMIHEASSMTGGTVTEMKVDLDQTERLNDTVFRILSESCEKPLDYFQEILQKRSNTDWYITAKEAKKHGLCNHIKLPEFSTSVNVHYEFRF
jgi:ATP-dependent Clp endopeptidase proteolytic subunit ClpP